MRLTRSQIQALPFIILLVLFSACFIIYPLALDDYWMMNAFKDGYLPNGDVADGIKAFFDKRYFHDTPRLSNFVVLPLLFLPSWISALVSAVSLLLSYILMCRLAGLKSTDFGGNTLISFMLIFFLPWSNAFLFIRDYAANYLWELPLMLWLIIRYLNDKSMNAFAAFFGGLILGIWHEAYSAPFIGAAVGLLLFKKVRVRKDRVLIIVGLTLGILWIMTAPGTWERVHTQLNTYSWTSRFLHLMWNIPAFFLFLILFFKGLSKPKMKDRVSSPLAVFVLFFCSVSTMVLLITDISRSSIPGLIVGYVGVVYLLGGYIPKWLYTPECRGTALWWAILALSVAHMSAVCAAIIDIHKEDRAILELWGKHTDRPISIFADISDDVHRPWYLLNKNFYEFHNSGWQWRFYSDFMELPLHSVIPYELKGFDISTMGEPIPGNAGAVFYKKRIVMPYSGKNMDAKVYSGNKCLVAHSSVFYGLNGQRLIYTDPFYRLWKPIVAPDSVVILR